MASANVPIIAGDYNSQSFMNIGTLVRFLFTGSAESIRTIAAQRSSLWLGLMFVLSAALAREYDAEYLPARPWALLIPFGASTGLSLLLFSTFWLMVRRSAGVRRPPFWRSYRMFLGVFLLTAPLAWLYAIPYERFLSPLNATTVNLWTLALVALWRVALTMRTVRVLIGARIASTTAVILTLAAAAVLIALSVTPVPLFQLMGGIRYSERDQMLASLAFLSTVISMLSLPLFLLAALVLLRLNMADWPVSQLRQSTARPRATMAALAFVSVAVWGAVLPFTQREQRLRYEVETQYNAGQYRAAVAPMSQHAQKDFPPQWDPPPRLAYADWSKSDLLKMVNAVLDERAPQWVEKAYAEKLSSYAPVPFFLRRPQDVENDPQDAQVAKILQRLPNRSPWRELRDELIEAGVPDAHPTTSPAK